MPSLATPANTEQMRASVVRRVRDFERRRQFIISVEYFVARADESEFKTLLARVDAHAKKAGCTHVTWFEPVEQADRGVVRFHTLQEWPDVDTFLTHWGSDQLRRDQSLLASLHVQPARVRLSLAGHHASATRGGQFRVLRTGQRRTWDEAGTLVDVPGADGDVRAGRGPEGPRRFIDNQNGTVTDTQTDLVWLKNANLFGEIAWEDALTNVQQLRDGAAGLTDGSGRGEWRLPNVNEMESLLNLDKSTGPAIDADAPFLNLEASNYWTSSSVALAPPLGWFVALAVGPPVFDLKINLMRAWPVKGRSARVAQSGQTGTFSAWGQPGGPAGQDGALRMGVAWPSNRFSDNSDGTVSDNLTGLVWLKDAGAMGRLPWREAINACNTLKDGTHGLTDKSQAGDWRLPNLNELRSLIDYSKAAPALPAGHPFVSVESSLYWSSTTVASAPAFARFVFVGVGPSVWDHKAVHLNVWPVRNEA